MSKAIGWVAADNGPEPPHPSLPFLCREHCEILANAKMFRKPMAVRHQEGGFDRKAKRVSNKPRDFMATYMRTLLVTKGFDPSQTPTTPSNARALKASVTAWLGHWFYGTILKTDAQWWDDEHGHPLLTPTEGKGETPKAFLSAIMANQRQNYMKKMKANAKALNPPIKAETRTVVSMSGIDVGGHGIVVSSAHSQVNVNVSHPPHTRENQLDVDHVLVESGFEQDQDGSDDEEASLLREIELIRCSNLR